MECYACDQPAVQDCARCANPYCLDHGSDPAAGVGAFCAACLDPVNAAPSSAVFRASLFALLAGSVLALWLLIRPPSVPGDEGTTIRPQPTPLVTPVGTRLPTGRPSVTPTPAESGAPTASPGTTSTPAGETPAPTEAGPIEYTVQEGDTWYGIAEAFGVDAENLAAVNGLTLDDTIQPGDVLVIPQ